MASSGVVVVHHLHRSRSQRVVFLLEELGVPYTVRAYARHAKTSLAPPELRAIHPLGKSPVLTDGDRVIAESGAILEYLVDTYDPARRFAPPVGDRAACLQYRYWMHYAEGSAATPLLFTLVFNGLERGAPKDLRETAALLTAGVKAGFVDPNVHTHLAFMEDALARAGPWFCGAQFTAADVQLSFVIEMADSLGFLKDDAYPQLAGFLQRVRARPAYQRAAVHGGSLARL